MTQCALQHMLVFRGRCVLHATISGTRSTFPSSKQQHKQQRRVHAGLGNVIHGWAASCKLFSVGAVDRNMAGSCKEAHILACAENKKPSNSLSDFADLCEQLQGRRGYAGDQGWPRLKGPMARTLISLLATYAAMCCIHMPHPQHFEVLVQLLGLVLSRAPRLKSLLWRISRCTWFYCRLAQEY